MLVNAIYRRLGALLEFEFEFFIQSSWTQKIEESAFQELSNGVFGYF
jgi:hypothetical protein